MPLLLQGSTLVLRQSFLPNQFFDDIARQSVTVFPGVPFMFDYLRQHLADQPLPRSLRLTLTAGASIREQTVAEFRRIFGLKIHSFYGTSETGGIAYDDSETIQHPLSVGRALPGTTITLRPWDANCGRVHVRGEAVASRYAQGSAEDDATFRDEGFLTGDLGYFAGDELVLTGRLPRFVNVAGRKVQPDEVEHVLLEMPEIANACVLGLPCDTRGEMLVAVIVPEQGHHLSTAAIRTYCSGRLSSHKIPRQYAFVDTLPVDPRGKTDLRAIESLIAHQVEAQPAES
jgi:long-chain acyl-CoA synthetase